MRIEKQKIFFISSPHSLIGLLIVGMVGNLLVVGCGTSQSPHKLVEQYSEFGIKAAQAGLWNESIMRWKRVLELDPNNAPAHNNLGVAYESQEKYEEAITEYKRALELEPNNRNYKENYLKCQRNYSKVENSKIPPNEDGKEAKK